MNNKRKKKRLFYTVRKSKLDVIRKKKENIFSQISWFFKKYFIVNVTRYSSDIMIASNGDANL
jgi:hypothetical protein